jgi:hypothetical protein
MKFIKFDNATAFVNTKQLVDGKTEDVPMPFYSDGGFVVLCAELSEKDLKAVKDTGRFYIVMGPGMNVPPIMAMQTQNPFVPADMEKPKGKLVDLRGNPLDNGKKD